MSLIYEVKSIEALYESMKKIMIGKGSGITNFNVGSRIRILIESIANILHQSQYDFYQGLKTGMPLAVFNGFEFNKLAGVYASGKLEFTRAIAATEDYPIAIGTAIILDGITYQTTVAGNILTGNTSSGQITAQCAQVGTAGNININAIDTAAGNGSFISIPIGIEAATNPVAFSGGRDEETDDERLTRFQLYITSLARCTVQGIISGAKSVEGVVSVSLIENLPQAGYITLYVDDGSGILPAALKTEVEKVINGDPTDSINYTGYRAAGIIVVVTAPTVLTINVTVEIKIIQNSLSIDADLETLAAEAIERYINTLTLGYDVIKNSIITAIKNAHADIFDVTITLPSSNITVLANQVARTGTVTVTSVRIAP